MTNLQEYDHAPMRTLCRVNLEAAGFWVLETADGDEALAALEIDWEVAAVLLADSSTDRIPIIFITARNAVPDRIRAYELGAQGYLTKPFDPAGLAATITKVLDQIDRGERDADLAETLTTLKAEQEAASKTMRPG